MFADRLVNDEDRTWFEELLKAKMDQDFSTSFDDVVVQKPVIFGDFMNTNQDPRPYQLIEDHDKVCCFTNQYSLFLSFSLTISHIFSNYFLLYHSISLSIPPTLYLTIIHSNSPYSTYSTLSHTKSLYVTFFKAFPLSLSLLHSLR